MKMRAIAYSPGKPSNPESGIQRSIKTRTLKGGAIRTKPAFAGYSLKTTFDTRIGYKQPPVTNPQKLGGSLRIVAKGLVKLTTGLILGFCLSSCTNPGADQAGTGSGGLPQVVSTSTIIADLTGEIAAEEIQLTSILTPGVDPHIYEPVPRDSIAFEQADLILYNGYNLEPGLINLMNAAGVNARKLAVGEVVPPLQLEQQGEPDPHVWGNVTNAIAMVNAIRDALSELSPENAEIFQDNAAAYTATLEQLHRWIEAQIATIPPENRRLVTTHDAFQYYAQGYGLEITGTLIGISTEEQPSAQTLTRLVEEIRRAQVPAIFAETTINPQLIRTVAEEAQVNLAPDELYSDSIGAPGSDGESYLKMMVSNTRAIVEALGGTYTPFAVDEN